MKVKIKADMQGSGTRICEIDDAGNEQELKNVTAAHISMGVGEPSQLVMRVMLHEAEVEGTVQSVTKCVTKDGELKEIAKITYKDGTEENY